MATKYQDIVFLQGDEATEAMAILDEQGEAALLVYLDSWDIGDLDIARDEEPWGSDDSTYAAEDRIVSYNNRLGYCGMCRVVDECEH